MTTFKFLVEESMISNKHVDKYGEDPHLRIYHNLTSIGAYIHVPKLDS